MGRLLGEPNDLVLDRGTVARTHSFDPAAVHGRTIQVGFDQFVGPLVRPGYAACDLSVHSSRRQIREVLRLLVRLLRLELVPIDGSPIEPWGRAGLEPP